MENLCVFCIFNGFGFLLLFAFDFFLFCSANIFIFTQLDNVIARKLALGENVGAFFLG